MSRKPPMVAQVVFSDLRPTVNRARPNAAVWGTLAADVVFDG
jgi:hypothetical protein